MTSEPFFLPGLPTELILAAYQTAPGNEIASGKMSSPESSSALVANTFGYFLGQPHTLPPLPRTANQGWPASFLKLEAIVRFPWTGGRHPCLDVLIETSTSLIGVESKRYEPYRTHGVPVLSKAYTRAVWGDRMGPYERVRDDLADGRLHFQRLDAAQLIKHAFGLRTAVQPNGKHSGKTPILFYLYAEPLNWPAGSPVETSMLALHRQEIELFASLVASAEVTFHWCTYSELLASWSAAPDEGIRRHATALASKFDIAQHQFVNGS